MVGPPHISHDHVVTLFWSRLRDDLGPEGLAAYQADLAHMLDLARGMPGFVSVKAYTADDGERLTIIVFDSADAQTAWRRHPEHVAAQRRGKDRYYEAYQIVVAGPQRFHTLDIGIGKPG